MTKKSTAASPKRGTQKKKRKKKDKPHAHTTVRLWPNAKNPIHPSVGMRLYRVGIEGVSLYYKKKDRRKIVKMILKTVTGAKIYRSAEVVPGQKLAKEVGTNYVLVVAPKTALSELEAACALINQKITPCTEAQLHDSQSLKLPQSTTRSTHLP